MEAHKASNMTCNVRPLKSRMQKYLYLKYFIASSKELLKHFDSNIMVGFWKLGNSTCETVNSNIIVQLTAGY